MDEGKEGRKGKLKKNINEALMAVTVQNATSWDVTPCSLVS
jgi:hypothetical protein